jgi:hypothetical protein
VLTLVEATQIVDEGLAHPRSQGLAPMTVAVLDARGCVVALKMEHGSRLLRPLEDLVRVSRLAGLAPYVRVPGPDG